MIHGFEDLNKLQTFLNKEVWLYIPGVGPDMYNGTAECYDPEIKKVNIEKIIIKINSIEIWVLTAHGFMLPCDVEQCFSTKEEAEAYMQKQVDDGTAWI